MHTEGTEVVGYSGESARERQLAERDRLRAAGVKHIILFTTQEEGAMIYCVSRPRTQADLVADTVAEVGQMLNEGGNASETVQID